MIKKYIIPKQYQKIYGKGIIYCKIQDIIELNGNNTKIYKVRMLNRDNNINLFLDYELKSLNIFDKFIVKKYLKKYY